MASLLPRDVDSMLNEIQQAYSGMHHQHQETLQNINALTTQLRNNSNYASSIEQKNRDLQSLNLKQAQQINNLKQELQQAKNVIDDLRNNTSLENNKYFQQYHENQKDLKQCTQDLEQCNQDLEQCKQALNAKNQELELVQGDITVLKHNQLKEQDTVNELQSKLGNIRSVMSKEAEAAKIVDEVREMMHTCMLQVFDSDSQCTNRLNFHTGDIKADTCESQQDTTIPSIAVEMDVNSCNINNQRVRSQNDDNHNHDNDNHNNDHNNNINRNNQNNIYNNHNNDISNLRIHCNGANSNENNNPNNNRNYNDNSDNNGNIRYNKNNHNNNYNYNNGQSNCNSNNNNCSIDSNHVIINSGDDHARNKPNGRNHSNYHNNNDINCDRNKHCNANNNSYSSNNRNNYNYNNERMHNNSKSPNNSVLRKF